MSPKFNLIFVKELQKQVSMSLIKFFNGKMVTKKVLKETKKIGPYLSCILHKIGANLYSNLAFAPFLCKKLWSWVDGWMDGWMDGWLGGGW